MEAKKNQKKNSNHKNTVDLDIVICIHNALDDVKKCIDSVYRSTVYNFRILAVDDGSDSDTKKYLASVKKSKENFEVFTTETALGYTKAANIGLRASTAKYIVLLNSDTIVPKRWDKKLIECAETDLQIGLVGPISNAASWQSVPKRIDQNGSWAVNDLPEGLTVDQTDELFEKYSIKLFPEVPLLNGFCILIKRKVIDKIGYLNENAFPKGYGEENDYCFRAADAGFKLIVADNTYIFHAKSKSYGKQKRNELAKAGQETLHKIYGIEKLNIAAALLKQNQDLKSIRNTINSAIADNYIIQIKNKNDDEKLKVLFLVPVSGASGGIHSIVQEVVGMRELNVDAKVGTFETNAENYYSIYSGIKNIKDVFHFFSSYDQIIRESKVYDIVVATYFSSIIILKNICNINPHILPAYYIQDYEPFFFEPDTENWKLAKDSYTIIPDALLFSKTKWLCDVISELHNKEVEKVFPSLDNSVYYPKIYFKENPYPVKISAMVRPSTPRRGAERTMRVLKKIKNEFGDKVEINIFGTEDSRLEEYNLELNFDFKNWGVLNREKVSELLRYCDIFIDLSIYQAFGRTGIEAMASGCSVVLPQRGGTSEYAVHGQNAILVDTKSDDVCYKAVSNLVEDFELRNKLIENGLITTANYSVRKAALSELFIFKKYLKNHRDKIANQHQAEMNNQLDSTFLNDESSAINYNLASVIIHYDKFSQEVEKSLNNIKKILRPTDELLIGISKDDENLSSAVHNFEKQNENVHVFEFNKSKSKYSVFNELVKKSVNPYQVFLSESVELPDNFLSIFLEEIKVKRVAAIAPISNFKQSHQWYGYYNKEISECFNDVEKSNNLLKKLSEDEDTLVKYVRDTCFSITKNIFNRIGGFNEKLTGEANMLEFCIRTRLKGYFLKLSKKSYAFENPEHFTQPLISSDETKALVKVIEQYYGKDNIPSPQELWDIDWVNYKYNPQKETDDTLYNLREQLVSVILNLNDDLIKSKDCVDSFLKNTEYNYELIINYNSEVKEIKNYLNGLKTSNGRIRLLPYYKNTGYVEKINNAITRSNGNFIALIDSYFVVTNEWLDRLVKTFDSQNQIGIVVPSTNSGFGDRKADDIVYSNVDAMNEYAENLFESKSNEIENLSLADLSCSIIKKELIKKIGGFDARFSSLKNLSADYCIRAASSGFNIILAKGVFVLNLNENSFINNDELFFDKWGIKPDELAAGRNSLKQRQFYYPLNENKFLQSIERAMLHLKENDFQYAAVALKNALDNYNNCTREGYEHLSLDDIYNLLGNCYLLIPDLEQAQKYFGGELELRPDSSRACLGLGQVYFASEMFDEAKTMFEWAVKNDPENRKAIEGLKKCSEIFERNNENLDHLEIQKPEEEKVSIIIPLFNKLDLTKKCVESIFENTVYPNYEIILVDNGSTDGTSGFIQELASKHDNISAVINDRNLGFAKANNIGAEKASGDYLLCLNNDIEAKKGWLTSLCKIMKSDSTVGAVGSKLLYPDGTIQHAGVAIINNKKTGDALLGIHIHQGEQSDLHEANEIKTYQALTAACLLIRKKAFTDAGGFDEEFYNGYEDVDLCFKLREKGWQLVYQPESVLIHYESQSGIERFSKVNGNINLLHKKWLGKINPDFVVEEDGKIVQTGSNEIKQYSPVTVGTTNKKQNPVVSIIIPVFNQWEYTEACIKSIEENTSVPYELIIIDNASQDNTESELKNRNDIRIIKNEVNLGFPKAINQGLLYAKGNYIAILNNDIIVTKGWLDRMLDLINSNESFGVAGPISNIVSGVQLDKNAKYNSIEEMHSYAEKIKKENSGKWFEFPRVAFLCTLIKQEVIDKIGGLDERFSPGNFEDDDFCLRAQSAGFKTVITKEVFIHHFGSKSFKANGTNEYANRLEHNKKIFIEKWGADPEEIWLKGKKFTNRNLHYPINSNPFIQNIKRGMILLEDKDYSQALTELSSAINNFDNHSHEDYEHLKISDLLNLAGNTALLLNELSKAEEYFKRELELNPESSRACAGLGEVFYAEEMYEESRTMFEWGIKNDPKNTLAVDGMKKVNQILGSEINQNSLLTEVVLQDGNNSR